MTHVSGFESILIGYGKLTVLNWIRCLFILVHEEAERSVAVGHLNFGQGLLSSLGSRYGLKYVVLDGGGALMRAHPGCQHLVFEAYMTLTCREYVAGRARH